MTIPEKGKSKLLAKVLGKGLSYFKEKTKSQKCEAPDFFGFCITLPFGTY
jgi:hypothetical protein